MGMNKKAAIITIHLGQNFGSVLQTIATSVVINRFGIEPIIINYVPYRLTYKSYWRKAKASFGAFLIHLVYLPIKYLIDYIFMKYLKRYCLLSETFYTNCVRYPKVDFYITGSDQVWNSDYNQGLDEIYYFKTLPENSIKIAYASSFGRESLPKDEYNEVRKLLRSYKSISVREDSAKKIIESMGYSASQLIDPTLMLDREVWSKYMNKRIIHDSYILVYLPYNIVNLEYIYADVRKISERTGMKIVTFAIGKNFYRNKYADRTIFFASPGTFLSLMNYADLIITNSFHGTAFSINLHKQFFVYMPSGYTTRITSLLHLCKLQDYVIDELNIFTLDRLANKINYSLVDLILETERHKTIEFLRNALLK